MKALQYKLEKIAELLGEVTSLEAAEKSNKETYLSLEYNRYYGGYRVVRVKVAGGGHLGVFGGNGTEPRLRKKEMLLKLDSILVGIVYSRKPPQK